MKKIIAIAGILMSIAVNGQTATACLTKAQQSEGKLVRFHWDWSRPEWYTVKLRVVSNQYHWSNMPAPPQAVYVVRESTAMTSNGVMLKSYGEDWVEYGGVLINPFNDSAYVVEHINSWVKCGYYSNVHMDVRIYSTLPPVGTLIDRGQYWLN